MSDQRKNRFELLGRLGEGGMGIVHRAMDHTLQREVALKFLPEELNRKAEARDRFLREARAASRLDHPNICTIYDIGETRKGKLFISMALYEGETLWDKILADTISLDQILDYASQICSGLQAAHAKGIIHRDVKPQNIFITEDDRVKILDFGIAKLDDTNYTRSGVIMGSAKFMSPEHLQGKELDRRSDIWSLGVILYRALTGEFPFSGSDMNMVYYQVLNSEPKSAIELRPELTEATNRILLRCLQKERDSRYHSAEELERELANLREIISNQEEKTVSSKRNGKQQIGKKTYYSKIYTFVLTGLILAAIWLISPTLKSFLFKPKDMILVVLPIEVDAELGFSKYFSRGLLLSLTKHLKELEKHRERLTVISGGTVLSEKITSIAEAKEHLLADMLITGEITGTESRKQFLVTVYNVEESEAVKEYTIDINGNRITGILNELSEKLRLLLDIDIPIDYPADASFVGTQSFEAFQAYQTALTYLEEGRSTESIDTAIRLLKKAIMDDNNYVNAHAMLGIANANRFRDTKLDSFKTNAIISARQAIGLEPNSSSARVCLANVYSETGEYSQAITELQTVIENDPKHAQAHRDMGRPYYYLKKPEKAEEHYREAIKLRPNYWEYYNALGFVYQAQGKHQLALEQYKKVVELRPTYAIGYTNAGAQYEKMKAYQQALEYYEKAYALPDDSPISRAITLSNLAGCQFREELYAESVKTYEDARELLPSQFAVWSNLANAYELAEKPDNARAIRRGIVQVAKRNEAKLNPLEKQVYAEALAKIGQNEQARDLLIALQKKAPENWRVFFGMARTWTFLENHSQALSNLQAAVEYGLNASSLDLYKEWTRSVKNDQRYSQLFRKHGLL